MVDDTVHVADKGLFIADLVQDLVVFLPREGMMNWDNHGDEEREEKGEREEEREEEEEKKMKEKKGKVMGKEQNRYACSLIIISRKGDPGRSVRAYYTLSHRGKLVSWREERYASEEGEGIVLSTQHTRVLSPVVPWDLMGV